MKTLKDKIFTQNQQYWTVLFTFFFIFGYFRAIIGLLQNIFESGSIFALLFGLVFWNLIAVMEGVIAAIFGTIVWGALLFIPYQVAKIFYRGLKYHE